MCSYAASPELLWWSSSDRTTPELGLTCSRIETPLPGLSNYGQWALFWRLARLIESFPF